ncbi:hypothetical protein BGX28_006312 [Mortierella sp. GBA30]|nr:hypothetical protein BGX28_006312 [Mortierella sp. GBA30]
MMMSVHVGLMRNQTEALSARALTKTEICLGPRGIKRIAGLQELEDLSLVTRYLGPVTQDIIKWLEHEQELQEDAYWPRLETVRITTMEAYKGKAHTDALRHISKMSLRFKVNIETDTSGHFGAEPRHREDEL